MPNKKGDLFVITGPSGVGKGTLIKSLMTKMDNLFYSISATTRQPRPGEVDGKDYYFIKNDQFEEWIIKNQFLEYAKYVGNYYGTPLKPVLEQIENGLDVILEIEVQGALQVKKNYPGAIMIFVLPPSMEDLRNRLLHRSTETEKVIDDRIQRAKQEIKLIESFDYIVINEDVDKAVEELMSVIQTQKYTIKHRKDHIEVI